LAHPVALAITLGLGVAQNVVTFQGFTWLAFVQALLPAPVIYLLFAIFEGFDWRGYLAPKT
jgi:hypothetical protein